MCIALSSINGVSNAYNWDIQDSSQTQSNKVNSTLDSLVSSGTITQDQETAIQSALTSSQSGSSQGTATTTSSQTDPLSSLVSDGTITQDQANSVTGALKSGHHHHHRAQGSGTSSADQTSADVSGTTQNQDSTANTLNAELESQQNGTDPNLLSLLNSTFSTTA